MVYRMLYITRKYPPMKGGMEETSFRLAKHLRHHVNLDLLAWGGHQAWLPFVMFLFFLRAIRLLSRGIVDAIHTGDALLSPLTRLLKSMFGLPVSVTVFGLDITWRFPLYQSLVVRCLNGLDAIVCISRETREACIAAGVQEGKILTIPVGVDSSRFNSLRPKQEARRVVANRYETELRDRFVLLSVGRFVERKGFLWFVETVLPRLVETHDDILYLLVGSGPLEGAVSRAIKQRRLEGHVLVANDVVSNDLLDDIYAAADVFVMPNIPVEGDMEGFGIVALEAASSGLPVVAARLEGIKDAVVDGQNGQLVEPLDAEAFSGIILSLRSNDNLRFEIGKRAKQFTTATFDWGKIAKEYARLIKGLSSDSP